MTFIRQTSYIDNEGDEIHTTVSSCDYCGKVNTDDLAFNYKDICRSCFKKKKTLKNKKRPESLFSTGRF